MEQINQAFRRFVPQLLHIIVMPIFFFTFVLIYRPLEIESFLGSEWFGVHLTILSCIILLSISIARLVYYYVPMKLNYVLYTFWCLAEIVFISFFVALYIWLVMGKSMPYFEFLTQSFKLVSLTLVYAYVILALAVRVHEYSVKASEPSDASSQKMRFYDNLHNLKIVLPSQSVLYIAAEENYVNIFYLESGKVREYVLRSSMKAIDELCQDNGLVRCHRSFYINPIHVNVLRRDQDGIMYAELDAADVRHIPVSKTYYKHLSEIL